MSNVWDVNYVVHETEYSCQNTDGWMFIYLYSYRKENLQGKHNHFVTNILGFK